MATPVSSLNAATITQTRAVERIIQGQATSDGAGVKLTRVLTRDLQHRLDPFLMLDNFGTDNPEDYIGGFPDHPHRGFETITYMIDGRMRHRDSGGNEGLLQNGGVQWMTAGRGLVHSELPEQEEGRMEGFQLWLNLPAKDKMCEPGYVDIQSSDIPELDLGQGVVARLIAGSSHGRAAAMQRDVTEPLYIDVHFDGEGEFAQTLPAAHNAFVYVYRGEVEVGGQTIGLHRMGILKNDPDADGVIIRSKGPARVLLIAGRPLNEPIAQHGPFVMNTQQELFQAVADYQAGKFA
ncbi:pirin family protein [Pollutimonas harenae]|uniref:Pirin family protein n=1 Tax=Pollutimonas harenae TaxID=657015 RepID=A0A853GZS7_9BURK|nr:pirin family protein [Pollutimonas harenae]NYT85602.1 pirin family protein [Pollutimonas harenae]TEA70683.1 pirin family protein [Pollutimonas harenae]